MTTHYLPDDLVCDRIFQDKDNDCTWRQTEFDSIFCCHQERVSVFMPPHNDTSQHLISHAMSPLICTFAPKKTHSRKFGNDWPFKKHQETCCNSRKLQAQRKKRIFAEEVVQCGAFAKKRDLLRTITVSNIWSASVVFPLNEPLKNCWKIHGNLNSIIETGTFTKMRYNID